MNPVDPARAFLALLLCGHGLADFVVQTERLVRRKRTSALAMLLHALQVAAVHALVLLPFFPSWHAAALVGGIAVTHGLVDGAKTLFEKRFRHPLGWFLADQLVHVAILVVAWRVADAAGFPGAGLWFPMPQGLDEVALVVAIYAFNANGGSAVVVGLLEMVRAEAERPVPEPHAGRLIGILERMIVLTLVWLDQWSAVGLVLAAKSLARFKELEDRGFGEVYLVGTLASVIVAGASGLLLRALGI